jgi:hypothetical protein
LTHHPLWQALLLRAFEPVLYRLCWSVLGEEDGGERVLFAFLLSIDRLHSKEQPVFVAIQRATARALFGKRRKATLPERVPLRTVSSCSRSAPHEDAEPFVSCLAREIVERLAASKGGEAVAPILVGLETPQEQTGRLRAAAAAAGEGCVAKGRISKRRVRALTRVRAELGVNEKKEVP